MALRRPNYAPPSTLEALAGAYRLLTRRRTVSGLVGMPNRPQAGNLLRRAQRTF